MTKVEDKLVGRGRGSGGGGTSDYNSLSNKPKINGVELSGNKSQSDLKLDEIPAGNTLPSGTRDGQVFFLKIDVGATKKGLYRYNGSLWQHIAYSDIESENVELVDSSAESISGTATNQAEVNEELVNEIKFIETKADVSDIVQCYDRGTDTTKTDIVHYDLSTLLVGDIVKVLIDETHDDKVSYYKVIESGTPAVKSFSYIGSDKPVEVDDITIGKNDSGEIELKDFKHFELTSATGTLTTAQIELLDKSNGNYIIYNDNILKKDNSTVGDGLLATWVFNDEVNVGDIEDNFEFISKGIKFYGITKSIGMIINYKESGDTAVTVYDDNWYEEAYKTIEILTEPTDADFIEWLKANATKVSGIIYSSYKYELTLSDDNTYEIVEKITETKVDSKTIDFNDDRELEITEEFANSKQDKIEFDYINEYIII